ncbi:MAG: DnaJ domain-containing protein [Acidobacteriota bacterium]
MATNYYSILGVPQNATRDQVRSRFLELARQLHPDRFRGDAKRQAEIDFQEITEAFNILSNPQRRRDHDRELARPQAEDEQDDAKQAAKVYMQRGVKSYREGNYSAAADSFDRATKENPEDPKTWFHLALACSRLPRFRQRGLEAITEACRRDAMNAKYHKLAGRMYAEAGSVEDAERAYNRALQWGGEDASVRSALDELKKKSKRGGLSSLFGRS